MFVCVTWEVVVVVHVCDVLDCVYGYFCVAIISLCVQWMRHINISTSMLSVCMRRISVQQCLLTYPVKRLSFMLWCSILGGVTFQYVSSCRWD
eukprot:m.1020844 g.1020844  ORF g.1020844 m.1020844 type:complete len:93 (+) comp24092_c0_seq3:83-361(+)